MTTDPTLLEADSLTRVYGEDRGWFGSGSGRAEVRAIDDVSMRVSHGEVVGITGPSGSGKSTLLHLLAGLDTPTSGQVVFNGRNIADLSGRERARFRLRNVGIVFQRFHLIPSLTARENIAFPLIAAGVPKGTRRARADELLERVGLADRAAHRPAQLSGGEQQRVAIARALVADPDLVVADEPTGELDTDTGAKVLDVLTSVTEGRTVVVASHDQQTLDRTSRLVKMRDGKRVDNTIKKDIDSEPALRTDPPWNGQRPHE